MSLDCPSVSSRGSRPVAGSRPMLHFRVSWRKKETPTDWPSGDGSGPRYQRGARDRRVTSEPSAAMRKTSATGSRPAMARERVKTTKAPSAENAGLARSEEHTSELQARVDL